MSRSIRVGAFIRSNATLRRVAGVPVRRLLGARKPAPRVVGAFAHLDRARLVFIYGARNAQATTTASRGRQNRGLLSSASLPRRGVKPARGLRRFGATLVRGLAVFACAASAVVAPSACSGSSDEPVAVPSEPVTTSTPEPDKTRILENRPFLCRGQVDLDLVRVTMRTNVDDAVRLDERCTGRIGRIEVETWTADGIKVQNHGKVAHDLVIESGYIKCHDIAGEYHQDGIHVMGGRSITFRNLRVDCLGNANLYLSEGGLGAVTPTDVVCEGCILGPNSAQTLYYNVSIRSGARGTTICAGRFRAIRVDPGAVKIVREGNQVLPHNDPSCQDVTGNGASSR